jgi:lipopolysaccharide/colanic/teichoic acid biosynthesis glycosyltransferase
MYKLFFKRFLDFILSFIILIIASPIILLTSILLLVNNKGNPIFIQVRPGKGNKTFSIIKFKTMNDKTDINGNLLSDDIRLTKLGKIIRKSSIDELPQLINVLKGDMSLVGPRPLLVEYVPLYNTEQIRRHNVRPGITGWAQTNGRNAISWERKFELDLYYVNNVSLLLDLKIALLTIKKVIKREGINSDENTTMLKFDGTN